MEETHDKNHLSQVGISEGGGKGGVFLFHGCLLSCLYTYEYDFVDGSPCTNIFNMTSFQWSLKVFWFHRCSCFFISVYWIHFHHAAKREWSCKDRNEWWVWLAFGGSGSFANISRAVMEHPASQNIALPLASYVDVIKDPKLFRETLEKLHLTLGTKFM